MPARKFPIGCRQYPCSLLVAILLVAGFAGPLWAAPPTVDARAAFTYDNNLNDAEVDSQQQQDSVMELDAILGYRHQLNEMSGVIAKAGVETDLFADTTDTNSLTLMASLAIVVQPVRGFGAPWFAVNGDFRWRQHDDSDIRDGTLASVGVTAGKRLTDRISMQLGYEFMDRNADEGRVFDLVQRTFSTVLDYRISNRSTAYFNYQYVDGGLVSTARRAMKLGRVSRAFAMDPAFGPGFFAWRLDGNAQTFRMGARYRLAEKTGLDAGVDYSHARAQNDNKWNSWRIGVSVVHRFD